MLSARSYLVACTGSRLRNLSQARLSHLLAGSLLLMALSAGSVLAQEGQYYYAGVSQTSPRNTSAGGTFLMQERPRCPVAEYCHVAAWTILWDHDSSGQYLEAGLLWKQGWERVGLFHATPKRPWGKVVAWVPFGTSVDIGISKQIGSEVATVWWRWPEGYLERDLALPGWMDEDGVHPTKFEAYAEPPTQVPGNIQIQVWPWGVGSLDTEAFLQEMDPYKLQPDANFTHFAVSAPE